jgi:glycosyltransferase involved in cell wall biosynthesis
MARSGPPLVSVVIPTRDRPALAARAVASVLEQTYPALEVVVVDDGSQPPLALPEPLAGDPRVRLVRCAGGRGAGAARNAGVALCRGPLLAFLDDDDRFRPAKLERQVAALVAAGDGVDAVESGYELWDGDRLVRRYLPAPDRDLARTLLEAPRMQPSTVLLRTAVFRELGGFDPTLRRVEDWELWVRFADRHRALALREVLVDRAVSAPAGELRWYGELVRRLEPRLAALPEPERARIRAVHLLVLSHLHAREGDRAGARARALEALRVRPRSAPRALLYLARSVLGERAWEAGKRTLRLAVHPLLRRLGRDPRVSS